MSVTNPSSTTRSSRSSVRAGLALSVLAVLPNLPVAVMDIDWGNAPPPPPALGVVSVVLALVVIVAAALAWRSGERRLIRLTAAALIVNALPIVPGLFMDMPAPLILLSAATVIVTIAAIVLMMRRPSGPVTVSD